MPELISICIPTYRRPSQLLHALHSCRQQAYRPLEIVIGDDSPHGDSEELVAQLPVIDGIRMHYQRNAPSLGQAANVNSLFARARGTSIVLLHDDDVLEPDAVNRLHAAKANDERIIAVYGSQLIVSERGELDTVQTPIMNARFKRAAEFSGIQANPVVCALWRQVPNDGYLVDAAAARAIGYRSFLEIGESCDTDFALRLALEHRGKVFKLIDGPISKYRKNRDGLSGSRDISWRFYQYLQTLDDRLSVEEIAARDQLLKEIAVQALIERAVHGHRFEALKILTSRYYPRKRKLGLIKLMFHLVLIVIPKIDGLSRKRRVIG